MYPNQKHIIFANKPVDTQNGYMLLNNADIKLAMTQLKDSTFKIYIYLCSCKNMKRFDLSRKDVMRKTGLSEPTYKKCIHELIDKKYLVAQDASGTYCFSTSPMV